ncbi:MAG: hypothetical protein ABR547_04090 [Halanaerobium sp.]
MKSAYEKAMERADEVYGKSDVDLNSLEVREELKEIMAPYFKGEIDAEGLWKKLESKEEAYLKEAQLMLVESIGLRNSSEQIKRRKEAVVAVESLKESGSKANFFEKQFTQAQSLQQQYQTQKKQLDEQVKQHLEQAQQGQSQNPLAAAQNGSEGQNGMNAQMRQQLAQKVSEFQEGFNKRFNKLLEKMKAEIE